MLGDTGYSAGEFRAHLKDNEMHGRPLQPDDPLFPALGRPGRYDTPISRAAIGEIIQRAVAYYRRTNIWGATNPASRLARLDD